MNYAVYFDRILFGYTLKGYFGKPNEQKAHIIAFLHSCTSDRQTKKRVTMSSDIATLNV